MTRLDYQVLFTALGFAVVAMQGETIKKKDTALRVTAIAQLIEEFCRDGIPEAFSSASSNCDDVVSRMGDAIARITRETGNCQPHELSGEFTQDEIARYWPKAFALAALQSDSKFKDS